MPTLQSLDDDSLQLIISELALLDALCLSLTCKELHFLAYRQFLVSVELLSPTRVRKLRRWIEGAEQRDEFGTRTKHLRFWVGSNMVVHRGDGTMVDIQSKVADVITAARNVRDLRLNPYLLLYRKTCVGAAICTLKHLVRLHLGSYDDAALDTLRALECPLKYLKLSMDSYLLTMRVQTPCLAQVLLSINHLRRSLHTLEVHTTPPAAHDSVALSEIHPFQAIRVLRVIHPGSIPFDLYSLFPAAELIATSATDTAPSSDDGVLQRLKHLEARPSEVCAHHGRFPRVSYLHLLGCATAHVMMCGRGGQYVEAIGNVAPRGLSFTVDIERVGEEVWSNIAEAAPALRCLMVVLRLSRPRGFELLGFPRSISDVTTMLTDVLEELAACAAQLASVSCLCVVLEHHHSYITAVLDGLHDIDVNDADAPCPSVLTRATHTFVRQVADAMPSLTYVGLAQLQAGDTEAMLIRDSGVHGWRDDKYDTALLGGDAGLEGRSAFVTGDAKDALWWKKGGGGEGHRLEVISTSEAQDAWCTLIDGKSDSS